MSQDLITLEEIDHVKANAITIDQIASTEDNGIAHSQTLRSKIIYIWNLVAASTVSIKSATTISNSPNKNPVLGLICIFGGK